MNWNTKPESVTLPPLYSKSQSPFLEQTLINTTSQGSLNSPGSNQPACMFSNSNPVLQPLLNIRNYNTPQQISVPNMHCGTTMALQTSVDKITYANNIKGPKQVNHSLQMSSGVAQNVWLNSPVRNSMFSHSGATVSQQTGLRTNIANVNALQNPSVTMVGDTYSMQVQMIPSNSVRVPVTYQGNQRLNSSLPEQQSDWAQQYISGELTYPDCRPLPKQTSYSSQSFLPNPNLQKQNPWPPTSLQIKNSHPSNPALTLQSKQTATIQSYQYAVNQTDRRLPPPPPYDCRYASQPLQNAQHVIKHSSMDVPHTQETHLPEMRKDLCGTFQPQNLYGNFCNFKISTNASQPFNDPIRSAHRIQIVSQNNQEERGDSCNLTSNQVLDTSATKEKFVKDIKTLIEIKKKFSEVARKIKINKNVLMTAGCIKTTKDPYSEPGQNSEVPVKLPAKMHSGPQVTPVTPGTANNKPATVLGTVEETSRTHSTLNSNIQDTNCTNFNQVNSILLNSVCSEKVPVPDQLHDLKVTTLKNSTIGDTHATLNNTQFLSGNLVHIAENMPANSETTVNKNRLLLSLLLPGDKTEMLLKDACETIQGSKPHNFETNPNTQITGNKLNMRTMETPNTYNINAKASANFFCLEQKSSTNGVTLNNDNHCPVELLATCLSLWTKQPSEPTAIKRCNESTSRTAVGISNSVESSDNSPFSSVENSQNKNINSSQVTTPHMIVQNYEASSAATTKGTELQIAVVSPLILSDVKTLPVKGMRSEALSETVYPVIKEGSVCSLQNQLAENRSVIAAMKVNESVVSTSTNTKVFPVIRKEKQNESLNSNSEGTPNTSHGKHIESEPDIHYPVCGQQVLSKVGDSDIVSSDLLQIDNICSLVEGDTSYNYQIAQIFSSLPVTEVEPQKSSLPDLQVINGRQQKEQLDNITESKDSGFPKDNIQSTDVLHKASDQSKSLQPSESPVLKTVDANSEILEKSILEHITKESTAALQQDSSTQEIEVSHNSAACDPVRKEILDDETSKLYPHDQLSELLKEFPYGIKAVNIHGSSVAQQKTDQIPKDECCDRTSCDSKYSTDQIKITILNSEQMKELFPEQNDPLCDVEELKEPQKENPVTKEESQCDPPVCTDRERCNSVVDREKDDIHCCALGWLCMVYEGIPKCQCNSIKNLTAKVEEEEQCSLETNSCKQEDCTPDRDLPMDFNSPPNNNPKIALPFPDGKSNLPEIEQGKNIKEISKTKNSLLRTEREFNQLLIKGDKTLGSLQRRKKKRNLKFHEITFHSNNETKISQESLQRKLSAQNSHPLKAKSGFSTIKFKDPHMKNGSSVRSVLPEKRKLKAGNAEQSVSEKRKLGEGNMLDSGIKRIKYDKQEQNKNGGSTLKIHNFLSSLDKRAKVKEKTISNVKSSGTKDSSFKVNRARALSQKDCFQRQKLKKAKGIKASKKNSGENKPCDSQYVRSSKLSLQAGSYGKSSERHSSSVQTSKESLNICSRQGKKLRAHHPEGSKTYLSGNVKEVVGGKQQDKMWVAKTKLDKNLNNNNEVELGQMSPKVKEQRKQYLNRVAFKCTEHESIFLTKLETLPKKFNKDKEKRLENKSKSLLPQKDTTGQQSMLEFKLCPDGLMNKSTNSIEEQKDMQSCAQKEQAPVQVTGIKSTKEDWIKGTPEEKRIPEASQEIGVCNLDPLGQFLRLHSNPRGSLLCAKSGTVPDIADHRKRGLDQLFSAGDTNGPFITSPSSVSVENGNDSKKFKSDDRHADMLCRVTCSQKLPKDVTEGKVISLSLPFRKVTNLLMKKRKKASGEAATIMVNHNTSMTPVLHSRPIDVQFSNHKVLKTDDSPNQVRAQTTLQAPNTVVSGNLAQAAITAAEDASMAVAGQSPVLMIIMEHLFSPVTLDFLHQVFSKFGTVLKIITFTKNSQFQVLLQYAEAVSAQQAKLALDGQNIHNDSCILRITFSKVTNLNVKYNSNKCRDYTRPNLPSSASQSSLDQTLTAGFSVPGIMSASSYAGAGFPPTFAITRAIGLSVPNVHGALTSPAIPSEAATAAGQIAIPGPPGVGNSVLLVSNLNPGKVSLQCLFILFGVYGNVQRVKIFFDKENALVQMANGSQAQLAMSHLSGQKLHGMPVHIMISKHQNVQLPQLGQKSHSLAMDYRNSTLHRFKKSSPKNFHNVFPPSATLFLYNIQPYISKDDLKILFSSNDRIVKRLKFSQKDRKMAWIQMGSVEQAIEALIDLHNHRLGKEHSLFVSFSKFTI
ncbi:retroelement silencing factor 1 isoform X1 [Saccopteryx bilineata]|uniref:retroelement silencing factor 1 isoform X1 n=1 Tax=Saccopteryx bilineata TaxID=59482 RepID=UPI00338E16A6